MKGISRVLFKIIACFAYKLLAMNKLDMICTNPIGMKKSIDTFLIFMYVSTKCIIDESFGLGNGIVEKF